MKMDATLLFFLFNISNVSAKYSNSSFPRPCAWLPRVWNFE